MSRHVASAILRRGGILALLAWWCLGSPAAALTIDAPPVAAVAGDLVTWHLRAPPPAWLVPDGAGGAEVVITGPDGHAFHRAAFRYRAYRAHGPDPDPHAPEEDPVGPEELQVRHLLRLPGHYDWSLRAPSGEEVAQGVFEARAGTSPRGPVTINPVNRRLLAFSDGTPVIPIGCNIAWANSPDRVGRFTHYLDELVANGGNACRVWMASWCGAIEGTTPEQWRLDQAWVLDQLLAAARARHVLVDLVLDNHYDLVHGTAFPYGATLEQRRATFLTPQLPSAYLRRLSYILARWGCDDTILAWELFNELDEAQPVREQCIPWVRAAAQALARLDQDQRLRTVSWCGTDFDRVADVAGIDLIQVHRYVLTFADPKAAEAAASRDDIGMLLEPAELAVGLGKPFLFGELGFQDEGAQNRGNALDHDGLLLRHQAWAGFLLGGYGSGENWWWDTYLEPQHLWSVYRGLSATVHRIDWKDGQLQPLAPEPTAPRVLALGWISPRQALLWPQPHHDTWYHHLVEGAPRQGLSSPLVLTLGGFLPSRSFRCAWIDMDSGADVAQTTVPSGPDGLVRLEVPAPDLDRVAVLTLAP